MVKKNVTKLISAAIVTQCNLNHMRHINMKKNVILLCVQTIKKKNSCSQSSSNIRLNNCNICPGKISQSNHFQIFSSLLA